MLDWLRCVLIARGAGNEEMPLYNHSPENYICPFCLVAEGVENAHVQTRRDDVFYRDEAITAFVSSSRFGVNRGHAIIIPNAHVENLYDLPDELSAKIHALERRVALAFMEVYRCDGVSSRQHNGPGGDQDVWHYHLHVFPRYIGDGLYRAERAFFPPEERRPFADSLRAHFERP